MCNCDDFTPRPYNVSPHPAMVVPVEGRRTWAYVQGLDDVLTVVERIDVELAKAESPGVPRDVAEVSVFNARTMVLGLMLRLDRIIDEGTA